MGQSEIEQRLRQLNEVLREREREHAELVAMIAQEIEAKLANLAAQEIGFSKRIAAAELRAAYLTEAREVGKLIAGRIERVCRRAGTSRTGVSNSPTQSSASPTRRTIF